MCLKKAIRQLGIFKSKFGIIKKVFLAIAQIFEYNNLIHYTYFW